MSNPEMINRDLLDSHTGRSSAFNTLVNKSSDGPSQNLSSL